MTFTSLKCSNCGFLVPQTLTGPAVNQCPICFGTSFGIHFADATSPDVIVSGVFHIQGPFTIKDVQVFVEGKQISEGVKTFMGMPAEKAKCMFCGFEGLLIKYLGISGFYWCPECGKKND